MNMNRQYANASGVGGILNGEPIDVEVNINLTLTSAAYLAAAVVVPIIVFFILKKVM